MLLVIDGVANRPRAEHVGDPLDDAVQLAKDLVIRDSK